MKKLFEHISNLIGKRIDEKEFHYFMQYCEDQPELLKTKDSQLFFLKKTGIMVICKEDEIFSIFLPFESNSWTGEMAPYNSDLPSNISPGDNRNSVGDKLGMKPLQSEFISGDVWDSYLTPPLVITFIFGAGGQKLLLISIERMAKT